MHVSRRIEFLEVVRRSPRPRDPYRSGTKCTAVLVLDYEVRGPASSG